MSMGIVCSSLAKPSRHSMSTRWNHPGKQPVNLSLSPLVLDEDVLLGSSSRREVVVRRDMGNRAFIRRLEARTGS